MLEINENELKREFDVRVEKVQRDEQKLKSRYNIAPSQIVSAVRRFEADRVLSGLKWGLVPSWAKDDAIGNKMINARAETLAEKPSFKNAFKSRRCIVPASGFYEWKRTAEKGGKQPFYFSLKDKPVFGFAGLWEQKLDPRNNDVLETCTIITTAANEVLAPVHDRMPVILKPADYDLWLDGKQKDTAELQKLLAPFPAEAMQSHAVSRQVNSPTFDQPELINSL